MKVFVILSLIGLSFGSPVAKRGTLLHIIDQVLTNRTHHTPLNPLFYFEGVVAQEIRTLLGDIGGQTHNTTHNTTHDMQKRNLFSAFTGMGAQGLSGEGDLMSKIMGAVNPLGLTLEAKPTDNGIDFIAGSKTLGLTADAGLGTTGANLTASVDKFGVKGESKLSGGLGAKGLTGGMEAKGSVDQLGLNGGAEADAGIGLDGLTRHASVSGGAMGKSGTAEVTRVIGPTGIHNDAKLTGVSDGKAHTLDAQLNNGMPSLSKSITNV